MKSLELEASMKIGLIAARRRGYDGIQIYFGGIREELISRSAGIQIVMRWSNCRITVGIPIHDDERKWKWKGDM